MWSQTVSEFYFIKVFRVTESVVKLSFCLLFLSKFLSNIVIGFNYIIGEKLIAYLTCETFNTYFTIRIQLSLLQIFLDQHLHQYKVYKL